MSDTRNRRPRRSQVALRPWVEILGAVALVLAANALASPAVAWLVLVGAVALFADGVDRALGRPCGGMRDYKQ
ncbi:MAG TPA: hypothetical protein VGN78_14465 [Solirubrobacteraceae bacterium]|nr:hypothetical protein [Solirubrobacteraceae bacterium]